MMGLLSKLFKKPKIVGVYTPPADASGYDSQAVRVAIENLDLEKPLQVFYSSKGTIEEQGYEEQIPLQDCYVYEEEQSGKKLLVLQIPKIDENAFVTIVNIFDSITLFASRIDFCNIEKKDSIWTELPYFKNWGFFDLHACETITTRSNKKFRQFSAFFALPKTCNVDDLQITITPICEDYKTYPTGGKIGKYNFDHKDVDHEILYTHCTPMHSHCAIRFKTPDYEMPLNFNIVTEKGKFLSRIAFLSGMAADCLKNYVTSTRTSWDDNDKYLQWLDENHKCKTSPAPERGPKFSIITPLWNTPKEYLDDLLSSVKEQTYNNYELVLVNASPENEELATLLKPLESDEKIRIVELEDNYGITINTLRGVEASSGDFVCMLDHDDFLAPNALAEYAAKINEDAEIDALFSDEDLYVDGVFCNPMFKTPINKSLLYSKNYCGHFLAIKRNLFLLNAIEDSKFDGSQDYYAVLSALDSGKKFVHIPKILYHWRASNTSVALDSDSKDYLETTSLAVLKENLEKNKIHAIPKKTEFKAMYRLNFENVSELRVSIISTEECQYMSDFLTDLGQRVELIQISEISADAISKLQVDCDIVMILEHDEPYEISGINNMINRSYWANEIVSAISVNEFGWILDAGFERDNAGELHARQAGRHIFHSGYSCNLASPLNVDAVSQNFLVMNSQVFQNLKIVDEKIITSNELTVIPDVQIVSFSESKPLIVSNGSTSVCFNPQLADFNGRFSLL